MGVAERKKQEKVERELRKAYGLGRFEAYEMLMSKKCREGNVDEFYMEVKRLARSACIGGKELVKKCGSSGIAVGSGEDD